MDEADLHTTETEEELENWVLRRERAANQAYGPSNAILVQIRDVARLKYVHDFRKLLDDFEFYNQMPYFLQMNVIQFMFQDAIRNIFLFQLTDTYFHLEFLKSMIPHM
jgi:hypothetical protein